MLPAADTMTEKKIAPAKKLHRVLEKVLKQWAFLECSEIRANLKDAAALPLEKGVELKGTVRALLSIRTTVEFDRQLFLILTGEEFQETENRRCDAFDELVNLLAGHLVTDFFDGAAGKCEPYLPQSFGPEHWPAAEPAASLGAVINLCPIEIRLWELE